MQQPIAARVHLSVGEHTCDSYWPQANNSGWTASVLSEVALAGGPAVRGSLVISTVDVARCCESDRLATSFVRATQRLIPAVARGDAEEVQRLLELGAVLDVEDQNSITPLVEAVRGGHAQIVDLLLAAGASVEHQGRTTGLTALHAAAHMGHASLAYRLIEFGAHPLVVWSQTESAGAKRVTVREHALEMGHREVVRAVDSASSVKGVREARNEAAKAAFLGFGRTSKRYADELKEVGVKTNAIEARPWRVHGQALVDAAAHGQGGVVRALLKSGASPDAGDVGVPHPLLLAAASGNAEVVSLLLDAAADVEASLPEDGTVGPWHAASQYSTSHVEVGAPPLWHASHAGHLSVVRLLLAAGADPNSRRQKVSAGTALMVATQRNHTEVLDELLAHGAEPDVRTEADAITTLMAAVASGSVAMVKSLINMGANPQVQSKDGRTAREYLAYIHTSPAEGTPLTGGADKAHQAANLGMRRHPIDLILASSSEQLREERARWRGRLTEERPRQRQLRAQRAQRAGAKELEGVQGGWLHIFGGFLVTAVLLCMAWRKYGGARARTTATRCRASPSPACLTTKSKKRVKDQKAQ